MSFQGRFSEEFVDPAAEGTGESDGREGGIIPTSERGPSAPHRGSHIILANSRLHGKIRNNPPEQTVAQNRIHIPTRNPLLPVPPPRPPPRYDRCVTRRKDERKPSDGKQLSIKEKVAIGFFIVASVHFGVIFLCAGCTLLYHNITQGSESVCFVDPDAPENAVLVGSDSSASVRDRWVAVGFGVSFAAGGLFFSTLPFLHFLHFAMG